MLKEQAKKALSKKVKKGFRGYPLATVALYGPTDKKATKVVVGIVLEEHADPEQMRKWLSGDVMNDQGVYAEVLEFIKNAETKTVVMTDRIIGCPHEEGIDYPKGASCPLCPFWEGRDRWTGRKE
jgi:hypothetical protein